MFTGKGSFVSGHDFTCCGKTRSCTGNGSLVSGHDFSRADTVNKMSRALAPGGRFGRLAQHSRIISIICVAIVLTFAGAGCKKAIVDPFPASGAVSGWQKTGDTRVFAAKDLWQYIDGDADQYIRAGVVSTSTSDYNYQNHLEAVVDVYTMGDSAGAHKILSGDESKTGKSVSLGDEGVAFEQSVTFRKGVSLVRIVAYSSTPDAPQALLALAHGVEAKL